MRRLLIRIASLSPLALLVAAPGNPTVFGPLASLTVSAAGGHFVGNDTSLVVRLDLDGSQSAPRRVTIQVPARFSLQPDRSAGSPVGFAEVTVQAPHESLDGYGGTVAVAASDVAPACGATNAIATWVVDAQFERRRLELPVSLVSGDGLQLEICPPLDVNVVSLGLALSDLVPPRTPGNYEWHAVVTPRSGQPYELDAAVPVPHVLTLRGRYDTERHTAILTGTLRAHGHARAGIAIAITLLDRTIVPLAFRDAWIAFTRTTRTGSYRVTVPLARTRGFVATALPAVRGCPRAAGARPACRTTTVSGIDSDPITVSVP